MGLQFLRQQLPTAEVREISRGGGGDGVETEACSLIGKSGSDRQPVKMSESWSDVDMWRCTDHQTVPDNTTLGEAASMSMFISESPSLSSYSFERRQLSGHVHLTERHLSPCVPLTDVISLQMLVSETSSLC